MSVRVALLDSAGSELGAQMALRFSGAGGQVQRLDCVRDPTGHGARVADVILGAGVPIDLLVAQVFDSSGPATPAAVAAAIDWAVAGNARLIHMSLGLAADRAVLARAVADAIGAGCILVAATPARGGPVYPAAYPGVIRGTGDARCSAGEIAALPEVTFGGYPGTPGVDGAVGRGASVGAAHVSAALLRVGLPGSARAAAAALTTLASYHGREQRTAPAGSRGGMYEH